MRANTLRRLRRDVARRAGAEPGRWHLTECIYCGHPIGIDWTEDEPRFEVLSWIDLVRDGTARLWVERTFETAHLDHVIPECLNGPTSPDNTVIACPVCNMAKGASPLGDPGFLDWLTERRRQLNKKIVRVVYA